MKGCGDKRHPPQTTIIRRDNHGRPSKQTDEGPSQESLVRLLPASAICPLVWLRKGRRRPDSSIPKHCNPGLSHPSVCFELLSFGDRLTRNRCVDDAIPDGLGGKAMNRSPQVQVTLSDDLLIHLRKTTQAQHVPLRWLVAGLVCDTMKSESEQHQVHRVGCGGR